MIRKKVCMLGAAGVGKTSLTRRYVDSIFSDDYLSTIGVKIDHKLVEADGIPLGLVIWDVQGQDDARSLRPSFLKGASGYCLVIDLARPGSTDVALEVRSAVQEFVGQLPYVIVLNKADLIGLDQDADLGQVPWSNAELQGQASGLVMASAKTNFGVAEAFTLLGQALLSEA